jgi:hypothetical protein
LEAISSNQLTVHVEDRADIHKCPLQSPPRLLRCKVDSLNADHVKYPAAIRARQANSCFSRAIQSDIHDGYVLKATLIAFPYSVNLTVQLWAKKRVGIIVKAKRFVWLMLAINSDSQNLIVSNYKRPMREAQVFWMILKIAYGVLEAVVQDRLSHFSTIPSIEPSKLQLALSHRLPSKAIDKHQSSYAREGKPQDASASHCERQHLFYASNTTVQLTGTDQRPDHLDSQSKECTERAFL